MNRFLRNCCFVPMIFLAGCGDDSKLSEVGARRLADKNVEKCFGNKEGVNAEAVFTGSEQFKQGWMFEYKFDGELCAILVGYDGAIELSRTKQ